MTYLLYIAVGVFVYFIIDRKIKIYDEKIPTGIVCCLAAVWPIELALAIALLVTVFPIYIVIRIIKHFGR